MDIKDLQNRENPNKEYYQKLIADLEKRNFCKLSTPYADQWSDDMQLNRNIIDIFKNKLKGKVLVDLGCGQYLQHFDACAQQNSYTLNLARKLQVKSYIGVDKFIELNDLEDFNSKSLDAIIVKADMLDFVSKLPDNSVNFTINGIDGVVILNCDKYAQAVAAEMVRATLPKGIIFGIRSEPTEFLKSNPEEHKLNVLYERSNGYMFEKR